MDIGMVVPPDNGVVERELSHRLLNVADVYVGRLPPSRSAGDVVARTKRYIAELPRTLDALRVVARDEIIVACTGASYLIGAENEKEFFDSLASQSGVPVVSALACIREQLEIDGIRRILLVSPYSRELTEECLRFWRESGYEIELARQIARGDSPYEVSSLDVVRALDSVYGETDGKLQPGQAVLISGTGIPTVGVIESRTDGRGDEGSDGRSGSHFSVYSSVWCIVCHVRRLAAGRLSS
jgi:maleate isomerase